MTSIDRFPNRLAAFALACSVAAGVGTAVTLPATAHAAESAAQRTIRYKIKNLARDFIAGLRHFGAGYAVVTTSECKLVLKKNSLGEKRFTIDVWSTKTARVEGSGVKVVCLDSECIHQHRSTSHPYLAMKTFATDSVADAEAIAPLIDQMRLECWNYRKN